MFKIPSYERRVVGLLFIFSLVIATSYVVARTIGDSLLLSRDGNEHLALVFVLSGVGTAIVASTWYFLTKKYSVATTIQVSSCGFAVLAVAALVLLPKFHHSFWLLATIYLMADIKGCINAINIVSALNTKLGRDASNSSWTLVGLAAPLAAVLMGGVLAAESTAISVQGWLVVGLGLDLLAAAIGFALGKSQNVKSMIQSRAAMAGGEKRAASDPKLAMKSFDRASEFTRDPILARAKTYVCSDDFRRWIGILIAAKVVVLTIIAFEWKSAVSTFYEGQTGSLVRFFGIYYGVVGITTIAIQLFVTGGLLKRRNVALPILLIPFLLLGVSVAIICSPVMLAVLVSATLGKSMDAWRRSVHDTTLNFLYTRIRRGQRRLAISVNSGLVKPLAEVAAACAIYFSSSTVYRSVLVTVLLIWILAAFQLIRLVRPSRTVRSEKEKQANGTEMRAIGTKSQLSS